MSLASTSLFALTLSLALVAPITGCSSGGSTNASITKTPERRGTETATATAMALQTGSPHKTSTPSRTPSGGPGNTATPTPSPLSTGSPIPTGSPIVFAPAGDDLSAYDPNNGFQKQVVISGNETGQLPQPPAVNGTTCFDPTTPGRFVIADTAGAPGVTPHWSILQLSGSDVGDLSYSQLGTLTPTYQGTTQVPLGCAFLSDGSLLTTDIGNESTGPSNGQLILWFPPIDGAGQKYCKLDVSIGTAGHVFVDSQDNVYVAAARGTSGIFRYAAPFPTSNDSPGGCGKKDSTGAPLVARANKTKFIASNTNSTTPSAITASGTGTFYVASAENGVIAEYSADGGFVRRVLQPPAGEELGTSPFSTGTPFDVAVDASGTLYYADLGLVSSAGVVAPGDHTGTVRRIRLVAGVPQAPETMDSDLDAPDGVGIFVP